MYIICLIEHAQTNYELDHFDLDVIPRIGESLFFDREGNEYHSFGIQTTFRVKDVVHVVSDDDHHHIELHLQTKSKEVVKHLLADQPWLKAKAQEKH